MSAILFGVPGKLKTLLARIPTNNTTLMGRLNATITSRAPADTAVLNTVLTPARSALLDNLDASILSRQSEASALARYNDLNGDIGSLLAAIQGNANYSSGIKKIIYTSVSRYGQGSAYSQDFPDSYVVDRDKTFIVPLTFGGVYMYSWNLAVNNNRVQMGANGGSSSTSHSGTCIVVEMN